MSIASVSSLLTRAGDGAEGTSPITGHLEGDHILVPLLTPEVPAVIDQLRVAASIARATDASLHVVNPVAVPEQTPMAYREELTAENEQALLDWAVGQVSTSTPRVEGRFLYARNRLDGVLRNVTANEVDTIVVPSESTSQLRRSLPERLALQVECDVVTVNGRGGYEQVPSILLTVAGGPHSGLATDVAQRVAADCDAWIDILHVVDEDASEEERQRAEAYVTAAYQRIARPESTTTWILEAEDVTEAIIEQSSYYGLTVVGAPTKGRLRRFITGSTNETVRDNARSVVLSARKKR